MFITKIVIMIIFCAFLFSCEGRNNINLLCKVNITYQDPDPMPYHFTFKFNKLSGYFKESNGKCFTEIEMDDNQWGMQESGTAYLKENAYVCELDNKQVFEINRYTLSIHATMKNRLDINYYGICKKLSKI